MSSAKAAKRVSDLVVDRSKPDRLADAQVGTNHQSYAGDKVIVCSKLEFPLILDIEVKQEIQMRQQNTVWTEERWVRTGERLVIYGTAFPVGGDVPEGMKKPVMANGFALTFNVQREFFERWLEQKKDYPPVRNGFLYMAGSRPDAAAMARERKDMMTGFEPIQHGKVDGEDVVTDRRLRRRVVNNPVRPGAEGAEEFEEENV